MTSIDQTSSLNSIDQTSSLNSIDQTYFLNALFQPNDFYYLCGTAKPDGGYNKPRLACSQDLNAKLDSTHQYVCLNPLSLENKNLKSDKSKGSYRHMLNVTRINAFLFESDILPIEVQKSLIPVLAKAVPIKFATLSGGKSVHLLVVLADSVGSFQNAEEQKQAYKQYWNAIVNKLEKTVLNYFAEIGFKNEYIGHLFDRSSADIVRLTRLGGAIRDNGAQQSVVYEGQYCTSDFLQSMVNNLIFDNAPKIKVDLNPELDYSGFKMKLRTEVPQLGFKLMHPEAWISSAGNYPLIYRYTLWAIDSCGVSKPVFMQFFNDNVLPALKAVGYQSDYSLGINDAYRKIGQ